MKSDKENTPSISKCRGTASSSKQFSGQILAGRHEGIWITDKDDNVSFIDSGTEVIIGLEVESVRNRNVLIDFDPKLAGDFLSSYCEAKLKLKPMSYRSEVELLSGGIHAQEGQLTPVEKDGAFNGMICTIVDATEQKRIVRNSGEKEENLRKIIENSSNVFFSRTTDHTFTYISPKIDRIIGYSPEEGSTKWTDLTSSNPINELGHEMCDKAIKTGRIQKPYELELVKKDGGVARVEVRETPVVENGKTTAIVGAMIDISVRDRIVKELYENKMGMKVLIERSPIPIVISRLDGQVEYINNKFTQLFGYSQEDIPSPDIWWSLAYPDENYRNQVKDEWINRIENSHGLEEEKSMEVDITCKNGSHKFVQIIWNEVGDKLLIFLNDLTRHKLLEREVLQKNNELKIAKKKAEKSDALKSAFLANMSHEIRTPMNSIIGFSNLLVEDAVTEDRRLRYLNFIKNAGEHLLRIIDDIIDVAKMESSQLKMQKGWVNVDSLLERIFEYHLQSNLILKKPAVTLQMNKHALKKDLRIYTDEVRLKQVFDNLITNAIKNTLVGYIELGLFEVSVGRNEITFYVKDTGAGIPKEFKKNLFKRFSQLDNQPSKQQGAGLGLSIIKGILILLKGDVWFESEENKGSCFYFKIPLTD